MRAFLHRWQAILSVLVIVAVSASVVGFALASRGFTAADVRLHDGGIWVTTDGGGVSSGLIGRFNHPIRQLDAAFYPPGGAQATYQLDVLQHDSTVLAWDEGAGKIYPVDEATALPQEKAAVGVPASDRVVLGGPTIAILDPAKGRVWIRTESTLAGLDLATATPDLTDLGPAAAVTVSADGTVMAVSITHDQVVVTAATGSPPARQVVALSAPIQSGAQVTAVGDTPVVLDPSTRTVLVADHPSVTLPSSAGTGAQAVLQQPGPPADSVLVATASALVAVPIVGTSATAMTTVAAGAPAQPVRLGDCIHAAWGGAPATYYRSCSGLPSTQPVTLSGNRVIAHPGFRVNHAAIVLNDLETGGLWNIDAGAPQEVDNWQKVAPDTAGNSGNPAQNASGASGTHDTHPPIPPDIRVSARAGRTTVLHLLDKVSDPSDAILVLAGVTTPASAAAAVALASGGQEAQLTLASSATDTQFRYGVSDGVNPPVEATVSVHVATSSEETAPTLFDAQKNAAFVAIGQSVTLSVLDGWRDGEGDPLFISTASAHPAGAVTIAGDGRLVFTAPPTAGQQTIDYTVSDGTLETKASIAVSVLGPGDPPRAPIANADSARTIIGQSVTIHPLANDIPGADGANPTAGMTLQAVSQPTGADLVVNGVAGTILFTAARPQTYVFDYGVSTGSSVVARGRIRVDVAPDPGSKLPPVALPDLAVIHGVGTVKVDVLANDYSPSGAILMVVGADSQVDGVSVGVVDEQSLLVTVTGVLSRPQIVHYQMTDGVSAPVTGDVLVDQVQDAAAKQPPIAVPDAAVVRAGDVTSIPVLANDIDPLGGSLTLVPGPLTVEPTDAGSAYTSGDQIRYIARESVSTEEIVTTYYTVTNSRGQSAVGTVTIRVEPVDPATNTAPTPTDLVARVVAGASVTMRIPAFGSDPNGDSVRLVGPITSPHSGRIVSMTHDQLVYEGFPTSSGTDGFDYAVTDRFGALGHAHVRVGVLPFGVSVPPFAVDDTATAAPGDTLTVQVLANDLGATGSDVSIALAPGAPQGVSVVGSAVQVSVPADGQQVRARYILTSGAGQSTAWVTANGQTGYIVPPIARDDVVTLVSRGQTSASVDVLANDFSPVAPHDSLILQSVAGTGTSASAGKLVVPIDVTPRTIPYVVSDPQGNSATGFVWVPARDDPTPHLITPAPKITVPSDGTLSVPLTTVVAVQPGSPVRLVATDAITTSPETGLTAKPGVAIGSLDLTGLAGYSGPASVTFTAIDSDQPGDAQAHSAVLTVDVLVGVAKPMLRCASTPLTITAAVAAQYHLADLCQVWTEDPAQRAALTYGASWATDPGGVTLTLSGSDTLQLGASTGVQADAHGEIAVSVTDPAGQRATATIPVRVVVPPPPRMFPIQRAGVEAGHTVDIDVRPAVQSPYGAAADIQVRSASQLSGPSVGTVHFSGSTVTVSIPGDAHGTVQVAVTVSDAPPSAGRTASSVITLDVIGVPDAPAAPDVQITASHSVAVSWPPPNGNGAHVTVYELQDDQGHTSPCPGSPCTLSGLTNGTSYRFEVRAQNSVGWSPFGPFSRPVSPGAVPDAPAAITAQTNASHTAVLTWVPPNGNGAPVTAYGAQDDLGHAYPCPGTPCTVIGLTNGTNYRFEVRAQNSFGWGPFSPFSLAVSSGDVPDPMAAPSAIDHDAGSTAGYNGAIHVAYAIPATQGRPVTSVEYSLTIGGAAGPSGSWAYPAGASQGTSGSQTISQLTNGSSYQVKVRACNVLGCGAWSPLSGSATPYGAPAAPSASASASGTVITFSWAGGGGNGRPVADYQTNIDGAGWVSRGASPGNQQIGYGYSQTHSVQVQVRDQAGQMSGVSPTASATTVPQPPPPPTVSVSKGAYYYQKGLCIDPSCAHIHITMQNFSPNTKYTVWFSTDCANPKSRSACLAGRPNGNNYVSETLTTDPSGSFNGDMPAFFGFPGSNVWVNVGNPYPTQPESNHLTWY